ncbi:chitin deacetylase 7 [Biomphalaria pfeifferi]|uniref:Chitin deacetylase 7 n=1 Tax=Biomphalaria pfeifferi TaxID=112525 RepID=A0AAD8CEG5_BIOPF|nr:chitin deacetylase 7 [Biomphalaria pfeifferi]
MQFTFTFISLTIVQLVNVAAGNESCSRHTCHPPHCRCPAHSIPGNLRPENIPQMILLAYDDAVNWDNWHYYLRLFPPDGRRKNPNGCPITASFFVSHNFTDYCMVKKLHARGMEIGDHSVSHQLPRMWWTDASKSDMELEVLVQRKHLAEKANIPIEEIRGWRSPFLQPAGDDLFSVLYENNFTYDATMTYSFPKNLYSPVLWPFTLDFGYTLVCNIARCPQKKYPGLWILPVVVLMDYREQKPCAYVDDCANMPRDKYEAYQMLWKNFLRNYRSNRAPLYLNLHSPWLNTDYQLDAMDEFIEKLTSLEDVYLVTITQALQWQMNPTPINELKDFEPFQCPKFEPNVEDRKVCQFTYQPKTTRDPNTFSREKTSADNTKLSDNAKKNNTTNNTFQSKITKNGGGDSKTIHHFGSIQSEHESEATSKGNDVDDDSITVHHHHNHKTHKPWFLKSSTGSFSSLEQHYLKLFLILCFLLTN